MFITMKELTNRMAYIISFFTSDERIEQVCALESSKLSNNQLREFVFVKQLKYLVGGNENLDDKTYVVTVVNNWKDIFIKCLKSWSVLLPKINEVINLIEHLEEGMCLGVSFNEESDIMTRHLLLLDMKGIESNKSVDLEKQQYIDKHIALFKNYKPFSYSQDRTRFGEQDRKKRVCRYCGRDYTQTKFRNNSHTISQCLGNNLFFTNDECDNCNKEFGKTFEQEFLKYISIYRSLAAMYENNDYFKTKTSVFELAIDKNSLAVDFKILDKSKTKVFRDKEKVDLIVDGGYIDFEDVYRALVKFVIGMLPDNELPFFVDTIQWINKKSSLRLPKIKETQYVEPESQPFINMFFRKDDASKDLPYLVAEFHVKHLEFVYAIPGCSKDNNSFNEDIVDLFLDLRKDENQWKTHKISAKQPTPMNLHARFFTKDKK